MEYLSEVFATNEKVLANNIGLLTASEVRSVSDVKSISKATCTLRSHDVCFGRFGQGFDLLLIFDEKFTFIGTKTVHV